MHAPFTTALSYFYTQTPRYVMKYFSIETNPEGWYFRSTGFRVANEDKRPRLGVDF
ncbi:MAG TPA: hypothetical protein VM802_20050 [Chitinophaga sp.]|uniref:hypothetical protein n=1 Tax=Chitinophaga sp. TaxID=1869181 RepID=UPI002B5EAD0A|nr:hypothetical protein [Chitinophaga sp.]HVI47181.1 hypothetical protein [Chitinophaga sp.]